MDLLDKEYTSDPCFGGGKSDQTQWPVLGPPPVQRLYAIYGKLPLPLLVLFISPVGRSFL